MFHVFIQGKKSLKEKFSCNKRWWIDWSCWAVSSHVTDMAGHNRRTPAARQWLQWRILENIQEGILDKWGQPHSGYQKPGGRAWVRICTYPSAPVNVPGGGLRLKWERRKGDMERCMTGGRSITASHHSQHLLAGSLLLQVLASFKRCNLAQQHCHLKLLTRTQQKLLKKTAPIYPEFGFYIYKATVSESGILRTERGIHPKCYNSSFTFFFACFKKSCSNNYN